MPKVSKDEVLKIAALSHIELHAHEADALSIQLEAVLSYAERVKEIAAGNDEPSSKQVNIFREDVVSSCDAPRIMHEAPAREANYFVVPKIIESAR